MRADLLRGEWAYESSVLYSYPALTSGLSNVVSPHAPTAILRPKDASPHGCSGRKRDLVARSLQSV